MVILILLILLFVAIMAMGTIITMFAEMNLFGVLFVVILLAYIEYRRRTDRYKIVGKDNRSSW